MDNSITNILEKTTSQLLVDTKADKTLNFYYDESRCAADELVRIWQGEESVVNLVDALKFDKHA